MVPLNRIYDTSIGLPDETSDEEAAIRYRKMSFGGLFKVYLHCARPPGERLLESLGSLCTHQKWPPIVEVTGCLEAGEARCKAVPVDRLVGGGGFDDDDPPEAVTKRAKEMMELTQKALSPLFEKHKG